MSGWIKLHRQFLDWEYYSEPNTKAVAIHLILKANIEPKKWQGEMLDRGELAVGIESIGKELGLTRQQTRTALGKLKKSGFCNQRATNKFTIVTVLNFDSYQSVERDEQPTSNQRVTNEQPTNNQRVTNEQPTNNQQITTTKEYKNIRSKEYIDRGENEFSQASPKTEDSEPEVQPKKQTSKKEKSCAKKETNLEQRMEEFRESLIPQVETYGKTMIREFFDYWSEPNQQKTKMLFEMQRTWSTEGRLRTWKKRQKQFDNEQPTTTRRANGSNAPQRATQEGIAGAIKQGIGRAIYNRQQREIADSDNQ